MVACSLNPCHEYNINMVCYTVIGVCVLLYLLYLLYLLVQCIAVQCNTWRGVEGGGTLATEEGIKYQAGKGGDLAKRAGEKKEGDLKTKNGVKGENQDFIRQSMQLD